MKRTLTASLLIVLAIAFAPGRRRRERLHQRRSRRRCRRSYDRSRHFHGRCPGLHYWSHSGQRAENARTTACPRKSACTAAGYQSRNRRGTRTSAQQNRVHVRVAASQSHAQNNPRRSRHWSVTEKRSLREKLWSVLPGLFYSPRHRKLSTMVAGSAGKRACLSAQ
jgi:hypothetical protein